jgi:hypothetical protein
MQILAAGAGLLLIFLILVDVFETIVLPRRASRQILLSRMFLRMTWRPWRLLGSKLREGPRREAYLGFFGPLAMLLVLMIWVSGLILGFALLHWALGSQLAKEDSVGDFRHDLYISGATLLAFGDVTPRTWFSRLVALLQAGMGIGIFALVISYLPVVYEAFASREEGISRLDEWAGSPPTAFALLRRLAEHKAMAQLEPFFDEYEAWAARLLESHLSYPWLGAFRSQHDDQSWLAALTIVLDASALVLVGVNGAPTWSAQRAFAMARHAAVDLAQNYRLAPTPPTTERLPASELQRLRSMLAEVDINLPLGDAAEEHLATLRGMYEPYLNALSELLLMPLPPWILPKPKRDDWQESSQGDSDRLHFD